SCTTDKATLQTSLNTCNTNLSTSTTNLNTCTTDKTALQTQLTQVQSNLNTCNTNFNVCTTSLNTCAVDKATLQTSINTCQTDLAACLEEPPAVLPGDGVTGAILSYTNNGDGTVTDNNTGLMWEVKDNSVTGIHDKARTFTWSTSIGNTKDP